MPKALIYLMMLLKNTINNNDYLKVLK